MPEKPVTRKEIYLATASGDYSGILPEPKTREEMYLKKIAENGGGGGTVDAYTKSETDTLLSGKADLVNGTVPLSQIPPAAIERIVTVANDIARFALTTAEVQLGDTVKVTSTNKMYFVIDTDHLDGELGYQVYVAGKAAEAVADQNGDTIDMTYVKAIPGKQLSTEDYTTAEKQKLSNCKTVWEGTQSEYAALASKTYDLYMIYEDEEENQNGD